MCDYFDDFNGFMDGDSFEDSLDGETNHLSLMLNLMVNRIRLTQDDGLVVDPFFLAGAMGFAYEEGLRERIKPGQR